MKASQVVFCATLIFGTVAIAHQGVQNPAVKARMDGMSAIAENLKVIGSMAKGEKDFDAEAARIAAAAIAKHAADTPHLFEANETDPKSEALPVIWEKFGDFTAKATQLETIARELSVSIAGREDLKLALAALGQNCKACHSAYRE